MKTATSILAAVIMTCAATAQIPDGEEILSRMDRNRDHTSIIYTATMEIHSGDQVRRKKMKAWAAAGSERKALVEFVNAEDAGTKYLMLRDNLWIYFPEEADVVKISGHMLKEGMMGGDVSYEDALEADKLTDTYAVAVEGVEKIEGRDHFVITLEATVRDAPYYKRKIWVDSQTYVATREEMYAKSGKLLKVARVKETRVVDGRTMPVRTEMESKLRRDSKTVFIMHEIELDRELDASMFTMRNLRR